MNIEHPASLYIVDKDGFLMEDLMMISTTHTFNSPTSKEGLDHLMKHAETTGTMFGKLSDDELSRKNAIGNVQYRGSYDAFLEFGNSLQVSQLLEIPLDKRMALMKFLGLYEELGYDYGESGW